MRLRRRRAVRKLRDVLKHKLGANRTGVLMNLDKLEDDGCIDVAGKRVIVRADLNVPVKDGKVTDATRLERVLPGLKALADRGAKVIVISHFGRPKNGPDPDLSLKPIAQSMQELLGRPIAFGADSIGEPAAATVAGLKNGDVAVLENLRFHKGEEKNDPEIRVGACEARRHLRRGRILVRTPCARFDGRADALSSVIRRSATDGRDQRASNGARKAGATDGGGRRWCKGFDENSRF